MKEKVIRFELSSKILIGSLLSLFASLIVPALIIFTVISL